MIDREIVEEIVIQVLKKMGRPFDKCEVESKPDLLVINALEGFKNDELEKCWNFIRLPAASENFPSNVRDIIFLDATQDLLVKGALGITDTPDSKTLANVMMKGLNISLIPCSEFEWIINSDVKKVPNKEYFIHLLKYKEMLERFGVRIHSLANLSSSISRFGDQIIGSYVGEQVTFQGKLLTQRDVQSIKEKKIIIRKSTIVTPLALDALRELGKTISVIDSKGANL
ncbi:hypothetical protein PP175_14205 [Aneurinibacillus sp. Ricciae_BoGa-3]|uniref:hypothetical protein n=1 Tax=Aneurinibacillus sp. Ricciae_BoGa-3 TaxID=3022697 RepID=UPI0023421B1C|nr:hypothetical protein [Aneurinibacillus sp. Ricciae_BoGa-3]WCK52588.1 hypothetical protein PP175_14205 [Aneurinibacillus sp. Ricciae_BoGa-3]